MYLNLIILSAATLANHSSVALVYSLIGMAFAIMMWVIAYHFTSYTLLNQQYGIGLKKCLDPPSRTILQPDNKSEKELSHNTATKTVVELREALLESDS